jgi:hypothetical protein
VESTRKKTDAQIKAQKNWESKNREKSNYLKYKSSTKTFIRNKATKEDIQEIIELANKRLQEF